LDVVSVLEYRKGATALRAQFTAKEPSEVGEATGVKLVDLM
jgi:hypothetical protein